MSLRIQMQQIGLQIESLRNELATDPGEFHCEMNCLMLFIHGQIRLSQQIAEERKAKEAAE